MWRVACRSAVMGQTTKRPQTTRAYFGYFDAVEPQGLIIPKSPLYLRPLFCGWWLGCGAATEGEKKKLLIGPLRLGPVPLSLYDDPRGALLGVRGVHDEQLHREKRSNLLLFDL